MKIFQGGDSDWKMVIFIDHSVMPFYSKGAGLDRHSLPLAPIILSCYFYYFCYIDIKFQFTSNVLVDSQIETQTL